MATRTYAEVQRAVYGRLSRGGMKLTEFPAGMQRIVLRMIDRGQLTGTRLANGDLLVER